MNSVFILVFNILSSSQAEPEPDFHIHFHLLPEDGRGDPHTIFWANFFFINLKKLEVQELKQRLEHPKPQQPNLQMECGCFLVGNE